jgi:hypothetical protein
MKLPKASKFAKPLPVPGVRAAGGVAKLAPLPKDIAPLASFPKPANKFPWEGGKTGMPRLRGAGKAHRAKQVETSSYGNQSLKSLMKPPKKNPLAGL